MRRHDIHQSYCSKSQMRQWKSRVLAVSLDWIVSLLLLAQNCKRPSKRRDPPFHHQKFYRRYDTSLLLSVSTPNKSTVVVGFFYCSVLIGKLDQVCFNRSGICEELFLLHRERGVGWGLDCTPTVVVVICGDDGGNVEIHARNSHIAMGVLPQVRSVHRVWRWSQTTNSFTTLDQEQLEWCSYYTVTNPATLKVEAVPLLSVEIIFSRSKSSLRILLHEKEKEGNY